MARWQKVQPIFHSLALRSRGSLCPPPHLQQDAPLLHGVICSFSACQQVDFSWFPRKRILTTGHSGSLTQLRCDSYRSQKSGSGSFPETGCSLLPDFSVNYSFVFWIQLFLQFFWLWLYSEYSRKITSSGITQNPVVFNRLEDWMMVLGKRDTQIAQPFFFPHSSGHSWQ